MAPEQPASPVITISAPPAPVAAGRPLEFPVRADPAPSADLDVGIQITASGCELSQPPRSVTVADGRKEATLTVPTSGAGVGANECTVTARIAAGAGYRVGAATAASASATITPAPATPGGGTQPKVTIAPTAPSVTEGSRVSFTLTATPRPTSELTVKVSWEESGSFLTGTRSQTVTIPTSGTAALTAATTDDTADESNGSVTVTVEAGSGYTVGTPDSATVDVRDNDPASPGGGGSPGGAGTPGGGGGAPPTPPSGPPVEVEVTAGPSPIPEGQTATFTLTATPAPASDLTVGIHMSASNVVYTVKELPVEATISAGSTTGTVSLVTVDDDGGYRDGTVGVRLTAGSGYTIGSADTASVTVTNDD